MQNFNRHLLHGVPARKMSLSPSCAAVVFYLRLRLIHHKGGSDGEVADAILRAVKIAWASVAFSLARPTAANTSEIKERNQQFNVLRCGFSAQTCDIHNPTRRRGNRRLSVSPIACNNNAAVGGREAIREPK